MWASGMLPILVLAGLTATSTALPTAQHDTIHKMALPSRPGFRLKSGGIDESILFRAINATLKKYHASVNLPPLRELVLGNATGFWGDKPYTPIHSRQTNQALENENDLVYNAPVKIGYSLPQNFIMDFDTGSSDIIIPGPRCGPAQGCPHATKYQNTGGQLEKQATYMYGGGNATGDEYQDYVTVAGLTYKHQDLLSISETTLFTSGSSNYDGIFGMAFTGASGSTHTTFMENLIQNKQLTYPEFSFYLGRGFNGNTGQDSQLTIGGRDTTKFTGALTQIPVVNQTAWIVEMSGISVNDQSAGPNVTGLAGIDTGTSFIILPTKHLAPIFALIPGAVAIPLASSAQDSSAGLIMWAYPCNTSRTYMPAFHLGNDTSGGNGTFALDVEDFNLGIVDGTFAASLAQQEGVSQLEVEARGLCLSSVLGVKDNVNPDLFVLGIPFIKTWYSVFHFGDAARGWAPYVGLGRSLNCVVGVDC